MARLRPHKIVDDLMHFECKRCNKWYPMEGYHYNRNSHYGIASYCKQCMYESNSMNKPKKEQAPSYTSEPVNNMFKNLGYDLKEDIHEQFKQKMFEKYGVDLS